MWKWRQPKLRRVHVTSPPSESGKQPQLRVRFTSSPDLLIGRKLMGLHVFSWTSEFCNLAIFAYDIEDLGAFIFPERGASINEFECWFVELDRCFTSLDQVAGNESGDSELPGCRITDLLAPVSRTDRVPDSQLLMLSSGFGLAQESGTPHGILPGVTMVTRDSMGVDLVSVAKLRP